jgi:hypothetical protein
MVTALLAALVGGPLLVAASSFLLVGARLSQGMAGVVGVVAAMLVLQLLAASGVSVVYRWCFVRPAVRGAGLLAALLVSVLALSNQSLIEGFAALLAGGFTWSSLMPLCLSLLVEGATVLGVALSACMVGVLICEVPLRWAQGHRELLSDGAFRMLRAIGVVLLCVISSAIVREQGVSRLIALLQRAIA